MKDLLEIKDLEVSANGKKILQGLNLEIKQGEIHVLMGPNGAGKTSLVYALMGHPNYKVTRGQMKLGDKNLLKLTPDQRANLGIFASFQKPVEIPGVTVKNLLRLVVKEEFEKKSAQVASDLKIDEGLLLRSMENFSGGEGKKIEFLQGRILLSQFLILDEIDSGLDIDSLRLVAENIKQMVEASDAPGILLITHNTRILKFLKPAYIHILINGSIVRSNGRELINKIEKKGYQWLTKS